VISSHHELTEIPPRLRPAEKASSPLEDRQGWGLAEQSADNELLEADRRAAQPAPAVGWPPEPRTGKLVARHDQHRRPATGAQCTGLDPTDLCREFDAARNSPPADALGPARLASVPCKLVSVPTMLQLIALQSTRRMHAYRAPHPGKLGSATAKTGTGTSAACFRPAGLPAEAHLSRIEAYRAPRCL